MNIYEAEFSPMYPVGHGLIIAAKDKRQAMRIAKETVTHTGIDSVKKVNITKPCVIHYRSGDY